METTKVIRTKKQHISSGQVKSIPTKKVEKDDKGNIIPIKNIWTKKGKNALDEYRAMKKKLDAESTETYTVESGGKTFTKTRKIKPIYRTLPSKIGRAHV